ncbi:uncharacterized protein LOC142917406 isoform X3 [Petromyzon marinus]|uniref:uncharacterized protein LOC142917406 isoform X3 n=1 Tax=Petromyzon marinus TaxID=7757 RepID=UPI003F73048C
MEMGKFYGPGRLLHLLLPLLLHIVTCSHDLCWDPGEVDPKGDRPPIVEPSTIDSTTTTANSTFLDVTYTVQSKLFGQVHWQIVCSATTETRCNVSSALEDPTDRYHLRVRSTASSSPLSSPWVVVEVVHLKTTVLSAPIFTLKLTKKRTVEEGDGDGCDDGGDDGDCVVAGKVDAVVDAEPEVWELSMSAYVERLLLRRMVGHRLDFFFQAEYSAKGGAPNAVNFVSCHHAVCPPGDADEYCARARVIADFLWRKAGEWSPLSCVSVPPRHSAVGPPVGVVTEGQALAAIGQKVALLHCHLRVAAAVTLTQVNWLKVTVGDDGRKRASLAVLNPRHGTAYPNSPLMGRVRFRAGGRGSARGDFSLELLDVQHGDGGLFLCHVATFPTGNFEGSVNLSVVEKPTVASASAAFTAGLVCRAPWAGQAGRSCWATVVAVGLALAAALLYRRRLQAAAEEPRASRKPPPGGKEDDRGHVSGGRGARGIGARGIGASEIGASGIGASGIGACGIGASRIGALAARVCCDDALHHQHLDLKLS